MEQSRIYLVGFMGAGKSTAGRLLAKRLGWKFVDLDLEIEKSEGRPVHEIFALQGEPHFRQLERQYLRQISARRNAVVALGGGAFAEEETRKLALTTGLTVWLKVSFPTAVSRTKIDGTRPNFATKERAEELYNRRESSYRLAYIHIETDNRSPSAVATELSKAIRSQ